MVVGFNHNFRYKGEVYHIQTEDSGVKSPNIVTLLYQGGTILASKKTSYADISRVDNLDQVVEELMKEQHKEMLRRLKAGEFDAVIERFKSVRKVTPESLVEEKVNAPRSAAAPQPASQPTPQPTPQPAPVVPRPVAAPIAPAKVAATAVPPVEVAKKTAPPSAELSLDEVILSYLMGDDKS